VDMPDAQPEDIPEDLSINDMESVIEIVLEKCLNIEDAISEHDETGDESETCEFVKEFQWCCVIPEIKFDLIVTEIKPVKVYKESLCFEYIKEINPPPPKA
jgi:hypothetical protein